MAEPARCEKYGTGHCGDTWGKPVFSSGRKSADTMNADYVVQMMWHSIHTNFIKLKSLFGCTRKSQEHLV